MKFCTVRFLFRTHVLIYQTLGDTLLPASAELPFLRTIHTLQIQIMFSSSLVLSRGAKLSVNQTKKTITHNQIDQTNIGSEQLCYDHERGFSFDCTIPSSLVNCEVKHRHCAWQTLSPYERKVTLKLQSEQSSPWMFESKLSCAPLQSAPARFKVSRQQRRCSTPMVRPLLSTDHGGEECTQTPKTNNSINFDMRRFHAKSL